MKKPALGAIPHFIWKSQWEDGEIIPRQALTKRLTHLGDVIKSRIDNNDSLLTEWVEEYNK